MNLMIKLTIFLSLLLLAQVNLASFQHHFQVVSGASYKGIIVPSEAPFPFFKVAGRFSPDNETIRKAEAELKVRYSSLAKRSDTTCLPDKYENLKAYKRQYFGYIDNGKKTLFISFIKAKDSDWQEGIIIAEGGGCRYLQVK